jgi:hypothetical protein
MTLSPCLLHLTRMTPTTLCGLNHRCHSTHLPALPRYLRQLLLATIHTYHSPHTILTTTPHLPVRYPPPTPPTPRPLPPPPPRVKLSTKPTHLLRMRWACGR